MRDVRLFLVLGFLLLASPVWGAQNSIGGGLNVDNDGNLNVNVAAGGAGDGKVLDGTAAGQADVMSSAPAGTEEGLVTRPILPATASTSAKQDTGNTSVASLDTKTGEVSATPTANTILGRLKDLLTGIILGTGSNVIGAVTQSGIWTVQPGNTANTTAWKVDGSAVTQPISAASLPLPTGAATSALQGGGLPAALGAGGGLKIDGSGTAVPTSLASLPAYSAIPTFKTDQTTHGTTDKVAADVYVGGAVNSATNPVFTVFPGTLVSGAVTSAMTGTTSTSVISATASNNLYITQCTTSNGSTTVSTDILLQDGSGGTTLYVLPAPAAATASTGGGGGSFSFPVPLKVPTAGNALFAANVTTGSSTKISCSGFRSTVSY